MSELTVQEESIFEAGRAQEREEILDYIRTILCDAINHDRPWSPSVMALCQLAAQIEAGEHVEPLHEVDELTRLDGSPVLRVKFDRV